MVDEPELTIPALQLSSLELELPSMLPVPPPPPPPPTHAHTYPPTRTQPLFHSLCLSQNSNKLRSRTQLTGKPGDEAARNEWGMSNACL